jgi:hypothetical protein
MLVTARRRYAGRDANSRRGADAGDGASVDGAEAAVAAASPWSELLA